MIRKIIPIFICSFLNTPAIALENEALQTKIQNALSTKYPGGTVDLRLCTYGECTFTTLITPGRIGGDLDDALEVSAVLKTIFENAGDLLEQGSRVSVNLRRLKRNCNPISTTTRDEDDGMGCTERKTIEADIGIGGDSGPGAVCSK